MGADKPLIEFCTTHITKDLSFQRDSCLPLLCLRLMPKVAVCIVLFTGRINREFWLYCRQLSLQEVKIKKWHNTDS